MGGVGVVEGVAVGVSDGGLGWGSGGVCGAAAVENGKMVRRGR